MHGTILHTMCNSMLDIRTHCFSLYVICLTRLTLKKLLDLGLTNSTSNSSFAGSSDVKFPSTLARRQMTQTLVAHNTDFLELLTRELEEAVAEVRCTVPHEEKSNLKFLLQNARHWCSL